MEICKLISSSKNDKLRKIKKYTDLNIVNI